MTREEAIIHMEIRRNQLKSSIAVKDLEEDIKAFDMAINSLKAWEKVKAKIRKGKYAVKKGLPERSLIYANGWDDGLEIAIDIIDRHLKGVVK